jgi:hypothetical protein
MSRRSGLKVVGVGFLLICSGCVPTRPEPRDYHSWNRRFVVKVAPNKNPISVYDRHDARDGQPPLWEINEPGWNQQCIVSNDGETVAVVWEPFHPREKSPANGLAVKFWNRQRGNFSSISLDSLCDDISGVSKRQWMSSSVTSWIRSLEEIDEDTFRIVTIDYHQCDISLSKGEVLSKTRLVRPFEWFLIISAGFVAVLGLIVVIVGWKLVCVIRARAKNNVA